MLLITLPFMMLLVYSYSLIQGFILLYLIACIRINLIRLVNLFLKDKTPIIFFVAIFIHLTKVIYYTNI